MPDLNSPPQRSPARPGWVYLVGAGPGDAELLTVRALRLLGEADVLVYDNLVSKEVLDCVPAGVERIYVGKKASNHALPQGEINHLLVGLAKQGRKVVRLKGGGSLCVVGFVGFPALCRVPALPRVERRIGFL